MTKQETFDLVVNGLREQGRKSLGPDGDCAYRSCDGLKCAVGMIIPDELYDEGMEGIGVGMLAREFPSLMPTVSPNIDILEHLQSIHDFSPVEQWESDFKALAAEHGLTYPAPEGTIDD